MRTRYRTTRSRLAVVVTVTSVWWVPMAEGTELGRLFTTPQERAVLDKLRREAQKPVAASEEDAPPAQPVAQKPREPITVNGFVKRSDGVNTVWVNGVNSLEGELNSQGFQIDARRIRRDRVTVTVSGERSQQIELRPGQTFDPVTGRMVDVYQGKDGKEATEEEAP